jgi:hypothetical protein
MTSLKEAALKAAEDQQATRAKQIVDLRKEELVKLKENWAKIWGHKLDPVPKRPTAFKFVAKMNTLTWNSSGVSGWRFTVEDIPFIYVTTYGEQGLHLIVTCPECGQEVADHFYNLADIGLRLDGRKLRHRCRERQAKDVAYAIGTAARDAKVDPGEIVDLALQNHWDLIARLTGGR